MSPLISSIGTSFGFNKRKYTAPAPAGGGGGGGGGGGTLGWVSATLTSDPGDSWFSAGTVVYSGGSVDEGTYSISLPFSVSFLGTSYSSIIVSSNSYLCFGSGFSLPSFQFSASNPSAPGIGVCAHPGGSTDTNVQYLAWRQDGSTVKMRWKGGYPYYQGTINRIWDITFTSGSNQYLVECRTLNDKDSSGTGNLLTAKNSSAFVATSTTPSSGTAFTLTAP